MLKRNTLREIKHSLGRYIAILAIVALGVGFFSGLKVSKTSMVNTGDAYLKKANFFDYRLICSYGFTTEDVSAITSESTVAQAEGSKWTDAICTQEDGTDTVLRIHSVTANINKLTLTAGRMPESARECVADTRLYTKADIGSKIILSSANSDETMEDFTSDSFTIVGIARSPYYMNYERGTTSLGNGTLGGFIYTLEEAFNTEYYSEIFVTLDLPGKIYSSAYEDALSAARDSISALCENRGDARYESIRSEAQGKIDSAREELSKARSDYESEKAKADAELTEAENKLSESQTEIDSSLAKLNDTKSQLESKQTQLDKGLEEVKAAAAQLDTGWSEAEVQFDQKKAELEAAEAPQQYLDALARERYEAQQKYEAGKLEIQQKQEELNSMQQELNTGKTQLDEAYQELNSAQKELDTKKAEYENSKKDAHEKFLEAESEIKSAEEEILKAQSDMEQIEKPVCYTLSRNTNVGYACFENDSNIVEGIANVFPVFFFLVAALVCMTTMNRMIDEQRTQIGVLKALGYSKAAIMFKYIFYAGSAALVGCITGFAVGSYVFPRVIWKAYDIMYGFASLEFVFDIPLFIVSLAVSLLCSVGVTWLSCSKELSEAPAQLIRPRSPKAGKRILLERIPFIWNRMKFLKKVSIRNIFRYKKRLIMMILGIGGCTALLLTGFGIHDSIQGLAVQQYTEIQLYDYEVTFQDALTAESLAAFQDECNLETEDILPIYQGNADLQINNTSKSVYMIVPENAKYLGNFVDLHSKKTTLPYPASGEALINRGLAEKFHIETGDTITLTDSNMNSFEFKVTGVFDNLVYNYVYISKETYKEQTGREPEYKTAFINADSDTDIYQKSAKLMNSELVSSVSVSQEIMDRIDKMMSSLNYIVIFVTISAAALAFIVLYNLTNINITERTREIATVKVLGFNGKETASYVFRENVLLTLMGAIVGLGLGIWLHAFVISQIKVDLVSFNVRILPISYILAVLLTLAFAGLVNFFMYFKTERINMAEALKSIE